jgi:hypothetical protein
MALRIALEAPFGPTVRMLISDEEEEPFAILRPRFS